MVRTLRERGVEVVFLLCGNGLKPFLDACVEGGMPVVDTRNEQAAAYMADAWGRMTGRLGVVATSAGPGFTNALTGLANSYWDGGPMLLISGCSTAATRGQGHFQELDQVAMAAPVCKLARFVARPETLVHDTEAALVCALTGPAGTGASDHPARRMDGLPLSRHRFPVPSPWRCPRTRRRTPTC